MYPAEGEDKVSVGRGGKLFARTGIGHGRRSFGSGGRSERLCGLRSAFESRSPGVSQIGALRKVSGSLKSHRSMEVNQKKSSPRPRGSIMAGTLAKATAARAVF